MTISTVIASDLNELVQLVNSAYRGDSSKKGWTTEADLLDGIRITEEELLRQFNQSEQYFLKATDQEGKIIGCVSLLIKGQLIYLGMLTVQPNIQATGIGKRLLAASEQFALNKQIDKIEMTVISVRVELIAWYQRRGYQLTGEKRAFPSDPKFGIQKASLEFVVLAKNLTQ